LPGALSVQGWPEPYFIFLGDRRRLAFVSSWVAADLGRCFQVMECDDVTLLQRWVVQWSDLIDFEILPVVPGKETAAALADQT
jgi:hypothetical protein